MIERAILGVATLLLGGALAFLVVHDPRFSDGTTDVGALCRRGAHVEAWLYLEGLPEGTRMETLAGLETVDRGPLLETGRDIGRARLAQGGVEGALRVASLLAGLDGARVDGWLLEARCMKAQGQTSRVESRCKAILEQRPDCVVAHELMFESCFAEPRRLEKAVERALAEVREDSSPFLRLGARLEAEARYREARSLYGRAAKAFGREKMLSTRCAAVDVLLARLIVARSPGVEAGPPSASAQEQTTAPLELTWYEEAPVIPEGLEPGMQRYELLQVAGEPTRKSRAAFPRTAEGGGLERWRYIDDTGKQGFYVLLRGDQVISYGPYKQGRAIIVGGR